MSALELGDAKAHLKLTGDSSVDDAYLQAVIDAAEAAIAKRTGPLEPTARTHRISGGCHALVLPALPVLSLTSVTPINGAALTLGDLYLNTEAGIVTYVYGGWFTAFAYDVVYQTGRSTVPDDLLYGVKELVRHMWGPQRGAIQRSPATPPDAGPGYLMPNRVLELIGPHETPGFA